MKSTSNAMSKRYKFSQFNVDMDCPQWQLITTRASFKRLSPGEYWTEAAIYTYRWSSLFSKDLFREVRYFYRRNFKWLKCFIFRLLCDPFMISFRFKQQISFMRSPHSIQCNQFTKNLRAISCLKTTFSFGPIFVNLCTIFFLR